MATEPAETASLEGSAGPGPLHGEATAQETVEEVLAAFRAEGGRVTTPRRLLIEALIEAESHSTAEELAEVVHGRAPDVHLSTIYRNLDELERLGIVEHAHLGHGPASYHLSSEVHGHFVCEDCGTLFEAPDEVFESLARAALTEHRFHIDPHHFAMLGRCAACYEKLSTEGR